MPQPKVTINSTQTCPFCRMEKEYLAEKGIAFENIFVDEDPKKAEKMIKKSGQTGVPVTVIEKGGKETIVVGFDREKLDKLLGIA